MTARALWVLVRWVARDVWRPLLVQQVPLWFLFAFGLVEADAIIDTNALRAQLTASPPGTAALFVSGCALLLALGARRMVAELLLGPRHAVLRRQPIPAWAWGPASLVVLLPVGAPLGVFAAFWYGPQALTSVLGWTLCVALPALCAASGRWWGLPVALLASAFVGGLAALDHMGATVLGLLWGLASLPLVGHVLEHSPPSPTAVPRALVPRPRGVVTALLHRDLLAVWRNERALVGTVLGVAPLVGLVTWVGYVNGEYPGSVLVRFPVVCMLAFGPVPLAVVARAARSTGRSFDPRHWPVKAEQRVAALALMASGTMLPSWAMAAVAAPPIGVDHARIAVFVGVVGLGAAWWVASRPGQPNTGSWWYWLAAALVSALWRPGPLLGLLLGACAWFGAVRALEMRRRQQ